MPFLGILFTLPDSGTMLNAIGTTSTPIFNDLMPLFELVIGIILPFIVLVLLLRYLTHH
jgi:hypothetical protein